MQGRGRLDARGARGSGAELRAASSAGGVLQKVSPQMNVEVA